MKNKSSTLERVPPWEYEMKLQRQANATDSQPSKNLVLPLREEPISIIQAPNTDQAFFEQNKDESTGDFKFTLSYFK